MSLIKKSLIVVAALTLSFGASGPALAVAESTSGQRAVDAINGSIRATDGFSAGQLTVKSWMSSTRVSTTTGTTIELSKTPGTVIQRSGRTQDGLLVAEFTLSMGGREDKLATSEAGLYLPLETVIEAYGDSMTSDQEQAVRQAAQRSAPGSTNPYVLIADDVEIPSTIGMLTFGYAFALSAMTPREIVLAPAGLKGSRGASQSNPDGSTTVRFTGKTTGPVKVNGKRVTSYSVTVTAGPDGVMRSYTSKFGKSRLLQAEWAPQDIVIDLGPTVTIGDLPLPSEQAQS